MICTLGILKVIDGAIAQELCINILTHCGKNNFIHHLLDEVHGRLSFLWQNATLESNIYGRNFESKGINPLEEASDFLKFLTQKL